MGLVMAFYIISAKAKEDGNANLALLRPTGN